MKRKIFALLLPVALALLPSFALANYSYVPLEQIPGFGNPSDFPSYLSALYKFGLWAIGLAALLMLTIGGFIYITSAGNNSQVSTAKKIIGDSIIGIILALVAYLLLYTINPDLVKFTPLTALPMPTMNGGSDSGTANQNAQNNAQQQLQQCSQWCNNAGGNQDYTTNCLAGCQQNYKIAQQAAGNGQSAAQIAQEQTDCQNYCNAGGDGTTSADQCYSNCMAAKAAQAPTTGNGSGCGVLGAAQQMSGWTYSQAQRHTTGYVDCSSFASESYTNAGCKSPGNTTADMYQNGQTISNQSALQPGTIIVYRNNSNTAGHAAICQNVGCTEIMAASSSHGQVVTQRSGFMFDPSKHLPARALPVSQYCPPNVTGTSC